MKLAYYVNYINHHRIVLAEEFYKLLGDDFVLIATRPFDPKELKGGEDYSRRTYCLLAAESDANHGLAMKYARESEICSFSTVAAAFAIERAKHGKKDGIVFETGERWLKRGLINLLSPRLLKWWWTYQTVYRKAGFYKLCASAYAANDHYNMFSYRDRCYKWGYFTSVPELTPERFRASSNGSKDVRLMWCARMIDWKHPELPILLVEKLRKSINTQSSSVNLHLDMYGDGVMRADMEQLVNSLGLEGSITFHGNVPNDEIHQAMSEHDIFLFTSDRNEGWGAVANEAMANGCAIVGSDAIGAIPYLVKDGYNGMVFQSGDLESLYEKVIYLIEHRQEMSEMQKRAYEDMCELWSPRVAAKNLLQLAYDLKTSGETTIKEGPCSKTLPIKI